MADQNPRNWQPIVRRRLLVLACVCAAWTVSIEGRLVYLQVFQRAELQAMADKAQKQSIAAPARRGDILDRHGRVLAMSVDADSIYAVPAVIENASGTAAAVCAALDDCTARDRQTLTERFGRRTPYAVVRRQVSPAAAARVAALGLKGIAFHQDSRRFYPNRELAAHVLGFVGMRGEETDSKGLSGIEATYDRQISGEAGAIIVQADNRRRAFSRIERPPVPGSTLELTIDEVLQYLAERELRAAVKANRAAGGSVVIMDPHTGEILALANEPTFNPNAFRESAEAERRNRAVQDLYEPGSTFKVVTASAAIEEGVMSPADPIDVSAGLIRIGSRIIEDVHRYGTLSFAEVIVKSSNVGAVKVGLRLGAERLGRYVHRFGFGTRLSPDFPGENAGIVWSPDAWSDSALASVAMGYQIGVTPLQMAVAASAVANGGTLVQPAVVRAFVKDRVRTEVPHRTIRRAISPATAAELTAIMEGVVADGTAKAAQLSGFTVAGKTGTAAKIVDGQYSKTDYMASFVGFVPSRAPLLTILVVIDSPHAGAYYGGSVAAPVFKQIADASLTYLGVAPTTNPVPAVMVARRSSRAAAPAAVRADTSRALPSFSLREGELPDLRGLGLREAVRILTRLGMPARVAGAGMVVAQDPPPGTPIEPGLACRLVLGRTPAQGLTNDPWP